MQSSVGDGAADATNITNAVAQPPQENTTEITTKPKGKRGRPKVQINWDDVGRMLEAGARTIDIAATIGCDEDTLTNRCRKDNKINFTAFAQAKRAKGEMLLREAQYNLALAGDKTMLVWLGKQRLGQSDKTEQNQNINHNHTVRVIEPYVDELADAAGDEADLAAIDGEISDVQVLLPEAPEDEDGYAS